MAKFVDWATRTTKQDIEIDLVVESEFLLSAGVLYWNDFYYDTHSSFPAPGPSPSWSVVRAGDLLVAAQARDGTSRVSSCIRWKVSWLALVCNVRTHTAASVRVCVYKVMPSTWDKTVPCSYPGRCAREHGISRDAMTRHAIPDLKISKSF